MNNVLPNALQLKRVGLVAITLCATFSQPLFAQVDAGALQQSLEQQLPLPSPLALPEPSRAAPAAPSQQKSDAVRFTVKEFVLDGVKTIPEAEVQALLKPWLGVPVTFEDIQRACDAIQNLYRDKGYTVQAIVPPQKMKDGVLRILVTEAKMGKVTVETPQGPTRFSKERAAQYITYANPTGEPLNMNALDRAIIILNETPGVMVAHQLAPGDQDGETNVNVQLTQPDLVNGRAELNNYGSRTTGANQGVFALNLNGPLGIGDSAAINGIASQGSQYIQGAVSLPGSPDGLRLGVSGTYLQYKNVSNYAYNGGQGDAWTTGVSAAYPLIRSPGANMNTNLNYDIKSYNNKNFNTDSVVSAYNINNLSAGLSGNFIDGLGYGAINNGAVTVVLGHLDLITPPTSGGYSVTPSNFVKMTVSGSRNQQLVEDGATTLYVAASGQFSSVNLNSAEQFYLGGPYGVRAYPVAQSGGAQGGLFTMELRHQLQNKITLSSFIDAGVVQQYKNTYAGWQGLTNANDTYSLMGAGFGVKWDYEGWNLGAMIAWKIGINPLYSSTGQAVNTDGTTTQPRGWATASYSF
ncbi:ShlB/FhaC/HecB family hemolysin secretion/activation protein [Polynucleobacter paneuropaeus]|uniref:ShlB/FhaC/HecB family hemolysin secretion/activation protein n=1 Tax=Polynucleobacter paneuropaeus TaxID=2527775 RepID=A0A9Q2WID2_9BURK|nr:ShlB/FhaC/HecB family hemolysin secretion/activation protein [Polynucleobacter paneuropaeus]MBT8531635.1 ShlB/FhaC/HecB family hemolysin secretion/activation protein [Polynucleobacter paneuropaeus]MBT8551013.1 ShlB/FhaC/HecB family hemolysin secretion/activation protein [Polynucleobacter paneuropaeus]MBT8601809.1 ShlB/FhaC/HecB family hemolysin secretion/activation protein [Polynucleobacter paneuropaeus]MBT8623761.1 ShlB/FhaC/HecB family hemolysin secretion/activation protein [Polynucleobact